MNDQELNRAADRIFGPHLDLGLADFREGATTPRRRRGLREVQFQDEYRPEDGVLTEARVQRSEGRLNDLPLLGRVSKNGRIYTEKALRDAARLYDGARSFLDHPVEGELRDRDGVRSVRDLIGKIENPRVAGDRVRGDLVLLESPHRDLVLSLAERAPELVGMSHRARGQVRQDEQGRQIVESLDKVFALELVTEPATVGGLQEALVEGRAQGGFRQGGSPYAPISPQEIWEANWKLFS